MYILTYVMTRTDAAIPWFSRPEGVNTQFGIEKREGRLIFDEFEVAGDGIFATYTATWDTKESYQQFIDMPVMDSFRKERQKYNQQTGSTIMLISEAEL